MTIEAGGPVVAELERRLRVSEPVIKFITVRMDEEEKRLAKVKALRGTRRKVSAEAPAAPPRRLPLPRPPPPAEARRKPFRPAHKHRTVTIRPSLCPCHRDSVPLLRRHARCDLTSHDRSNVPTATS